MGKLREGGVFSGVCLSSHSVRGRPHVTITYNALDMQPPPVMGPHWTGTSFPPPDMGPHWIEARTVGASRDNLCNRENLCNTGKTQGISFWLECGHPLGNLTI